MNSRFKIVFTSISFLFVIACSSSYLKMDKKEEDFQKNKEFEDKVIIKEIPVEPTPIVPAATLTPAQIEEQKKAEALKLAEQKKQEALAAKKAKKSKKKSKDKAADLSATSGTAQSSSEPGKTVIKREPEIEDEEGFLGRRPIQDPFRAGEEVVHDVHYFKVSAGELFLKVDPFVEVNGRKAYTFTTAIKSSSMFSTFYSADDKAVTYVDFMDLVPHVFSLTVKETGQLKDAKGLIDLQKNTATYWEKKFTKKNGQEEKKLEWEVLPFSQNVYSAAYYMRLFKWEVGKEYAFRVADQGENLVFKGKALRKEKLETEIGTFDTIVIKPEITVKGVFRPIGDIFFWLSDDDRKFILRIESNIKIGTIVSEVTKLNKGQP